MILQKIKKSIEKIGIPCFLDYNDATSYCAVLIPETNGKESIKVDIQFIWEDGNPILLADEWIKSLRMNKELKVIVLGSENNYAGYVLRVKVIDVSICSYIPTGNRYTITIENDPAKGTVSGAGKYLEGKTCTLTAYPNEQYYFNGWLTPEDDVVHENPYSFTVDRDATYGTAYESKYHVVVQSSGNGTVSGSGYYEPTESCTITATPNTGYHFVNWTVNELELTTSNPYTFIPTGDITITANFIPYYDISVSSSGNGSVSGGGTYNSGETVSLTATPNEGYVFVNWTEGGEEVSTSNPYTFTCTGNRTIVGNFVMNPLKINTNGASSVILTNSSNQTYTWNLVEGENNYYGDVEGFAINEITGLKKGSSNYNKITSIDASQLTSWTTVETQAFTSCSNLTSITFPDSIITINVQAFTNCSALTSITFPEGLTTINSQAFSNCSGLTSINIPENVSNIVGGSFTNCSGITTITVDSNNTTYNDGNGSNCIIETATNTLVVGCKNTTIPNTVVSIGSSAFNGCYGLTSIILPDSITTINAQAFAYCTSLTSINIPENVSNIVGQAFEGCSSLTFITVDSNNTTYNDGNGSNCIIETATNTLIRGCKNTTIPNTVVSIGAFAFSGCEFTSITLPNSLTSIGMYAFLGCSELQTLVIPANVSSIGILAFWNVSSMMYIEFEGTTPATLGSNYIFSGSYPLYVPSSAVSAYQTVWPTYASRIMAKPQPSGSDYLYILARNTASVILTNSSNQTYTWNLSIGINYYEGTEPGFAINEITGLKKGTNYLYGLVSIDASKLTSWTTVEQDAFYSCRSLASFSLPNSITTIGNKAFYFCPLLVSINIPPTLTTIGEYAFGSLPISSITLPNSITSMGSYAIFECKNLTSINLPNSLTSIETGLLYNCSGLTSITSPSTITTIRQLAFANCTSLESMTFLSTTPPTLEHFNVFDNTNNCPIYVPSASVNDYKTAFYWSTYASRIQPIP